MTRRAVIYIRTSSETQGENSSPVEQEAECLHLAQEKGLSVVRVYRDVEKYRVGNKLVEPSGTRSDRPGLLAMLNDATKDEFDVILAWREDRLYRGLRSMLTVLETVQDYKIEIMLAKENFDPKITPVRAWAAQIELDGMKERLGMGVKARLKAGKANTGQDCYGYIRIGEKIHLVEEEAEWVRKIFEWYNQSIPLSQIRERLIDSNAPQKGSSTPRHIQWARSSIQGILESAKEYAYGYKEQSRGGEIYQIPVEPIIDIPTYEFFKTQRAKNKTNSPQQIRHDYLLSGHLKCSCNLTWQAKTASHRRSRKGDWIERKTPIGTYFCPQPHKELRTSNCPKSISTKQAEAQVWEKVSEFITNPDYLLAEAEAKEWVERKTLVSTYFCPQPHKEIRSPECPKSVSAKRAETQVWEKLYEFVMNPDFLLAQAKDLVKQLQQRYEHLQEDRGQILEELEKESNKRQQVITEARKK